LIAHRVTPEITQRWETAGPRLADMEDLHQRPHGRPSGGRALAFRQVFLGSDPAAAGLGVTVSGRTMGLGAEMAMVSALGLILIVSAVLAFSRQE
jgi:hypothetical protein